MENTTLYKELNNIPLADDDPQGIVRHMIDITLYSCSQLCVLLFVYAAVLPDDGEDDRDVERVPSLDSMSSRFTNDSNEPPLCGNSAPHSKICRNKPAQAVYYFKLNRWRH